jgi:hypothetical protein
VGAGSGRAARAAERSGFPPSGVTTARGRVRLTWDQQVFSAVDRDTGTGPDTSGRHEWERMVWVAAPGRSRVEERRPGDDRPTLVTVTTPGGHHWWRMGPLGPQHGHQPWDLDGDRWRDPLGDRVADALVYPGWLTAGLTLVARRPARSATGRAAWELDLRPTAPAPDPLDASDVDAVPSGTDQPDLVRVTVDRQTGAVLGWRSLVRGRTFHRAWWTELTLGETLPDRLFDGAAEPDLAPWDGPSRDDMAESGSTPADPPAVELASAADPAVRQAGLLVGQIWGQGDARVERPAREGHPVPPPAGPFGPEATLRVRAGTSPVGGMLALYDAGRVYVPTSLALVGADVGSASEPAGRFTRVGDGTVEVAFRLPPWRGRLHLLLHLHWAGWGPDLADVPGPGSHASYAFTLLATDPTA